MGLCEGYADGDVLGLALGDPLGETLGLAVGTSQLSGGVSRQLRSGWQVFTPISPHESLHCMHGQSGTDPVPAQLRSA